MTSNNQRTLLLEKIFELDKNFDAHVKKLSLLTWDFDGKPAMLSKSILRNVLGRYTKGELDENSLHEWADFLELRDDVEYPEHEELLIADVLHELANPLTEGRITVERANQLVSKLG